METGWVINGKNPTKESWKLNPSYKATLGKIADQVYTNVASRFIVRGAGSTGAAGVAAPCPDHRGQRGQQVLS